MHSIKTNIDSDKTMNITSASQYISKSKQSDSDYSNHLLQSSLGKISNKCHQNQVSNIYIRGVSVISLLIDGKERLCLAQISNTLLKNYSYNEIHNRRVALGINCIQCTPVQLEILRRSGAMPVSSRRCGMITKREAERLVKSFLEDNKPPVLPENFAFNVHHKCGWGSRGIFYPTRYNSSRAKCIRCFYCSLYYSPNKFIFHAHNTPDTKYIQPDTANFNSWRRHLMLINPANDENLANAWEDVKAIFNGGTRKRMSVFNNSNSGSSRSNSPEIFKSQIDYESDEDKKKQENNVKQIQSTKNINFTVENMSQSYKNPNLFEQQQSSNFSQLMAAAVDQQKTNSNLLLFWNQWNMLEEIKLQTKSIQYFPSFNLLFPRQTSRENLLNDAPEDYSLDANSKSLKL
jgi:hypothetical protein